MRKEFGKHYLLELVDCAAEKIESVSFVQEVFMRAIEKSGASIIHSQFEQYQPYGVTGFVLISESHGAIHTWPEERFATVDVFTCGDLDMESFVEELRQGFQTRVIQQQMITRCRN